MTVAVFAIQIFQRELVAGPGFRTSHMSKLTIDPGQARYDNARSLRFFEDVVDDARHLPGLRVAGLTSAMPFSGPLTYLSVVPDAYRLANGETAVHTWSSRIDEQYFQTMGMTLLAGRGLHATDTADAPRVAIVNDTFARHYWPDGNIIGRRFRIADAVREPRIEVVAS